ncbi:NAD(P)-binding protein [Lophiostoma macrostomum CBS 122681]|uniref:NAD(P)-binding protein n=1 Tax=Lophiostoma macrostomum CBS 122681 TaxID=1314788 RepID=A0A6A6TA95_9PLEO|nr:NAD(P)-binding protein [Lophiostoma macrostomum CBS 122681]
MDPPYPSMTSLWHTNVYPAIEKATATDKTVVVTGASSGIGRAAAIAFAKAGATHVALISRRETQLKETEDLVKSAKPGIKVTTHALSIKNLAALKKAAGEIGVWDVVLLNAGRIVKPAKVEESYPELWWDVFETNVKGTLYTSQAFLPTVNPSPAAGHKPTIIGVSAGVVTLPPVAPPNIGASAYVASKAALLKLLEHIAAERPDLTVVSAHPGVVHTALMEESGMQGGDEETMAQAKKAGFVDDESLPAHFFVWLTTPDAAFLDGKFVFANWDVQQLVTRKDEIATGDMLTSVIQGWPFQPAK